MQLTTKTYAEKLDKWEYGSLAQEAKRELEVRPDLVLKVEHLIFKRVKSTELNPKIVSLDYGLEGSVIAYSGINQALMYALGVPPGTELFKVDYARRYYHLRGGFDLLVSEKELIYIVQHLSNGNSFVQWSTHIHDGTKLGIMQNADIAVLQNTNSHKLPLVALVNASEALVMGKSLIGSNGRYREISHH